MTLRAILTAAIAALALAATPVLAKDLHPKPHKPHVTRNAANCATTHTCDTQTPNTQGQAGGSGQTHGQGFIGETMDGNNI